MPTPIRSRLARLALGAALVTAVAVPLLTPGQAQAWWHRGGWGGGWGWRPGLVIAPPVVVPPLYAPAYYPPPAPAYYAPPPAYYGPRWVPGHYDWRGFWVPGHYR
jgi:hypothetical protein